MITSVINTDPILSVPNASSVPNVPTVLNVRTMTMNDPSVPKSYLVYQQKQCIPTGVPNVKCSKVSEPNVSKLTRNDAQCTKH